MGLRFVVPLTLLASALLVPFAAAAAAPGAPACVAVLLAADVAPEAANETTRVEARSAPFAWSEEGGVQRAEEGCPSWQLLRLATSIDASGAVGVLRSAYEASPGSGPAGSHGGALLDRAPAANFSIGFEASWDAGCATPAGSAWVEVGPRVIDLRLDAPQHGALCAILHTAGTGDAVAPLVDLAESLLQALEEDAAFLAPSVATLQEALADLPTQAEAAGVEARRPDPPVALATGPEGSYHVEAAAQGGVSPDGAAVAADAAARTPGPAADDAPAAHARADAPAPPPATPAPARAAEAPATPAPAAPAAAPAPAASPLPTPPPAPPAPRAEPERAPPQPTPTASAPAPAEPVRIASGGARERPLPEGADVGAAAAVGALLALVGFALYQRVQRPRALEHALRQALYEALQDAEHALTAGELAARVGAQRKTADYHLRYLARLGVVRATRRDDGVTVFGLATQRVAAVIDPLEDALLALVRTRPGVTTRDAADTLAITRPRAERRLRDLQLAGRLTSTLADGERRFFSAS